MVAHTVGAKLRAKRGRPRKDGSQERGRSPAESPWEAMRPALEARCRLMGWQITDATLAAARDQRTATVMGRFHMVELIDDRQYRAAQDYERTMMCGRSAQGLPSGNPSTMRLDDTPFGLDHETEEQAAEKRGAIYKAEQARWALIDAGWSSYHAVNLLISGSVSHHSPEPGYVQNLRRGLDALVKHFRID